VEDIQTSLERNTPRPPLISPTPVRRDVGRWTAGVLEVTTSGGPILRQKDERLKCQGVSIEDPKIRSIIAKWVKT